MTTKTVRIYGRVQGVGFRWSTQAKARELGINGWVRNETDGSVTALLQGSESDVSEMLAWCQNGPPQAQVDRVEEQASQEQPINGFEIKR